MPAPVTRAEQSTMLSMCMKVKVMVMSNLRILKHHNGSVDDDGDDDDGGDDCDNADVGPGI